MNTDELSKAYPIAHDIFISGRVKFPSRCFELALEFLRYQHPTYPEYNIEVADLARKLYTSRRHLTPKECYEIAHEYIRYRDLLGGMNSIDLDVEAIARDLLLGTEARSIQGCFEYAVAFVDYGNNLYEYK